MLSNIIKISQIPFSFKRCYCESEIYQINLYSYNNIKNFTDFIYEDAKIYLKRKYDVYKSFIQKYNKYITRTSTTCL